MASSTGVVSRTIEIPERPTCGNFGEHLDIDREVEIRLALGHGVDKRLVLGEFHPWFLGKLDVMLVNDLAGSFVDGVLDHLPHHRAAVEPAQVRDGRLAPPEALQLHLGAQIVELGIDLVGHALEREHHPVGALQTLARKFR